MTLNNVIFIDRFPKLDLHGFDRATGEVAINDFINDNIKMYKEIIVIVHGNGTGTLRIMTKEVLARNKNVLEYKTNHFNSGCTIVKLNLTNKSDSARI